MEKFWRIIIHVPMLSASEQAVTSWLDVSLSKELSAVLEAIESVPEVGRVGNYEGVYELGMASKAICLETARPPNTGQLVSIVGSAASQ